MERSGILKAVGAALLFGLSTPFAKGLLESTPPQMLAGLLYLGSGVGLGIFWLVQRTGARGDGEAGLSRRDLPWLAGAIVAGGVIGPLLLMLGLERTAASTASLLLNLEGVLTALLAWVIFRENADRRIVIGMAVIVLGGVLISWDGQLRWGSPVGPLLIAGACMAWGIDNNLTQKVSAVDPVQSAALKGLVAGVVNLSLSLLRGGSLPGADAVASALVVGFACFGVSLVLFISALRQLGTARTGAYFSLAPFVGALLSIIVFHDPVTPLFVGAALLMGAGVWIHLAERHEHSHVHEPMSHTHRHRHDAHHQHEHGPDDPPGEPHTHLHHHPRLEHAHPHYPDIHHRHGHS